MSDPRNGFFGHPRALATLFFTEMWERFTFYGMRALLVLFLVDAVATGGYGFDDKTATAVYGLYTAAVFMAALPGGWIADRLIGAQRAVLAGGTMMTVGNLMLAIPMYLLYELGILFAQYLVRQRAADTAQHEAAHPGE